MKEGMAYFTDTYLTSIGLLIFFFFFVAMLFWVFRKSSSEIYDRMSQFPLEKGGRHEHG